MEFNELSKDSMIPYQFGITEDIKQDIVFMPSTNGLRIFDINTGKHLPNSNDKLYSLNCAHYSSKNLCVYSTSRGFIKTWTTEKVNLDPKSL